MADNNSALASFIILLHSERLNRIKIMLYYFFKLIYIKYRWSTTIIRELRFSFNLNNFSEDFCLLNFRFIHDDIRSILRLLNYQHQIEYSDRSKCSSEESYTSLITRLFTIGLLLENELELF